MAHHLNIRIRGYHLDVFQHVNNARYLEFLEEARWDFFEQVGLTPLFLDNGLGMAVVNININYRHSAKLNDLIEITTSFQSINQRSAVISQLITRHGTDQVIADAHITFVGFDLTQGKSVPFSPAIRETIQTLIEDSQ